MLMLDALVLQQRARNLPAPDARDDSPPLQRLGRRDSIGVQVRRLAEEIKRSRRRGSLKFSL